MLITPLAQPFEMCFVFIYLIFLTNVLIGGRY
jgi:hypothetical protein